MKILIGQEKILNKLFKIGDIIYVKKIRRWKL